MKTFFLHLFLITCYTIFAQSFAPIGAKWNYQIGSGCCNNGNELDFVEWTVTKDTVIHGKTCRMILKKGIFIEGFPDTIFIYQEQQQIYYFDFYSDTFTLLYDFSKQKNESWLIKSGDCELNIIVKEVSMVNINGHNLKRLQVTSTNSDYEGYIIEKIGFLKKPQPDFSQYCYGLVSYYYYDGLRCYEDPELGFYDFQIAPSCDYVKVNNENKQNTMFQIYPNPTSGSFTVFFNGFSEWNKVIIHNSLGQIILEDIVIFKSQKTYSLKNQPTGVYFLEIQTSTSKFYYKIILQNGLF